MIILGLDVGSTGCKCVAYTEDGIQLTSCYREYPIAAGSADMDAEEMFEAVSAVLATCAASVHSGEIASIAVTSFGESFVAVDRNGRALSRIIMYTDKRGTEENEELIRKVGYDRIMYITCEKPDAMYSLPKIMWTMKNVEGVRGHVWKFLQATDYICFRLSGEAKVNETHACRTMAYNVEYGRWEPELLEAAGIREDLLPEPVPCGSVVGDILPSVANALGLPTRTKIITVSQDQIAAAVGAGVLQEGEAVDGTGSVECITPVFRKLIRSRNFTDRNFVCVPHVQKGLYATYAFNFAGGVLLKWFRDCFVSHLKPEAARQGVSVYRMLDELCPAQPSGVIVVPHFMGAGGTPDMSAAAKGTFTGMTMATTVHDLYRAVMEGLTFEMAYNMETLHPFGIEIDSLRATGGGASSPLWLQMKADILGRAVTPVKTEEAGAAGCAMTAAVTLGVYDNLFDAADNFVKPGETYYPEDRFQTVYREKYEKYKTVRAEMLRIYDQKDGDKN